MAQVLTEGRQSVSVRVRVRSRRSLTSSCGFLQIGAAGMFLMVGFLKLSAIRNWSAI